VAPRRHRVLHVVLGQLQVATKRWAALACEVRRVQTRTVVHVVARLVTGALTNTSDKCGKHRELSQSAHQISPRSGSFPEPGNRNGKAFLVGGASLLPGSG